MPRHSALRCVSCIRQNNAKPLISNVLRFIVTCLLTGALWVLFHCSRHSFACLQLDAGTSIAVVQRYLGHKNVATTEVYVKISDAQKRASVGCITLKK